MHQEALLLFMYIALLMLLLAVGGAVVFNGIQRHRPNTLSAGSFVLVLTGLFFGLLSFWGEMLWFEELDQSQRFWTVVFAQGGFAAIGALVGGLGVFILTLPIPFQTLLGRIWPAVAGALSGWLWGFWNWQVILKYMYRVSTEIRDPILQRDTGFYLFTLPFYDALYWGLLWITAIALVAAVRFAMNGGSFNKFLVSDRHPPTRPSSAAEPRHIASFCSPWRPSLVWWLGVNV